MGKAVGPLRGEGLRLVMLTGDRRTTVEGSYLEAIAVVSSPPRNAAAAQVGLLSQ